MGNAAVAGRDQMACRGKGALPVLDEHLGHVEMRNVLVDHHHRQVTAQRRRQRSVVGPVGHHHQSVHLPVVHAAEAEQLALEVAAGAGHEHGIAVPGRLVLERAGELGEERVGDVGRDQADGLGAAEAQPLGQAVGFVVEVADRRVDPRGGARRQRDALVDVARHRRGRHIGAFGHLVDGAHRRSVGPPFALVNRFRKPVASRSAADGKLSSGGDRAGPR